MMMKLACRPSAAVVPLAGTARLFGCLALVLSAALIFGRPAEAIVINIDPGNVGESFIDRSFDLDDFDGQSADGSTLTVDFVFNPKRLAATAGEIDARLQLNWSDRVSFPFGSGDGFLLDENGNAILTSSSDLIASPVPTTTIRGFDFENPDIVFSGIRFSLTLPDSPDAEVVSAFLRLNGEIFDTTFTVRGPRQLPEPASLALFGLGLAGLAVALRRRRSF